MPVSNFLTPLSAAVIYMSHAVDEDGDHFVVLCLTSPSYMRLCLASMSLCTFVCLSDSLCMSQKFQMDLDETRYADKPIDIVPRQKRCQKLQMMRNLSNLSNL